MTTTPTFEHTTCGRCGGTGRYSYNALHGSTCYGCKGRKWKYTARGKVAANYFQSLLKKPALDVRVGDKVWHSIISPDGLMSSTGWFTVREVSFARDHLNGMRQSVGFLFVLKSGTRYMFGASPDERVVVKPTPEAREAALAAALAYQSTLTMTGKPSKRKAATGA